MKAHLTLTTEPESGECPECHGPTVLVCAGSEWSVDSEQPKYEEATGDTTMAGSSVTIDEEITGHWCPKCSKLRSLSYNG